VTTVPRVPGNADIRDNWLTTYPTYGAPVGFMEEVTNNFE